MKIGTGIASFGVAIACAIAACVTQSPFCLFGLIIIVMLAVNDS